MRKQWLRNIWKNVFMFPCHPFTLEKLTAVLNSHWATGKFQPIEPTIELLITLFGTINGGCRYSPDNLDADKYRERICCWVVKREHHFYGFLDHGIFKPLAYIRIDEDLPHGPNSYLDRIIRTYYFDEGLNRSVGDFLDTIHTPPKISPLGEEINQNAIELALIVIDDDIS